VLSNHAAHPEPLKQRTLSRPFVTVGPVAADVRLRKDEGSVGLLLNCFGESKDRERFPIRVQIGRPYLSGTEPDTWACPVAVDLSTRT